MQESSYTKFCMSACIFMIIITLVMNFVFILGVFDSHTPSPILNQSIEDVTKVAGGDVLSMLGTNIIGLFTGAILASGGLILVVALAGRTGSWNILSAYLFGLVFWGSWGTNIAFINSYGDFFAAPAMGALYLIITVVMIFIFAGATIGILGGTE